MKKSFILLSTALFLVACGETKKEETKQTDTTVVDEAEPVLEEEVVVEEAIPQPKGIDQRDPEKILEGIFMAAETGNYEGLENICASNADSDCKDICSIASANAKKKEEFKNYFTNGSTINTEINGNKATVEFKFGPGGKKRETLNFVLEGGKWYIVSF